MRRLTAAEVAAYDHVPPYVLARVRVQRVAALTPGADGMTLGRYVLLRSDGDDDRAGTRRLLAHELVHARQWFLLGAPRFLWRYLRSYVTNLARLRRHEAAYLAIPLEEQARAEAAAWAAARTPR